VLHTSGHEGNATVLVLQLASSSLPLTINYILLADCAASAWLGQVSPAICHTTALNYLTGGRLAGSGPKDQFVTISHYKLSDVGVGSQAQARKGPARQICVHLLIRAAGNLAPSPV
jgi:hypothetical protein